MQVGSTLGEEHFHRCSIPQGCPFSMAMVALRTKPWINLMCQIGAEPRTLADDVFMHAGGAGHAKATIKAMESPRKLLQPWWPTISASKLQFAKAQGPVLKGYHGASSKPPSQWSTG
jgi:hypothetical protein